MSGPVLQMVPPDGPDRSPPFSVEAEQSVIGGMIFDPARIVDVLEILTEDAFYREAHRRLFRAIVGLWETGAHVDEILLTERLRAVGDLEAAGGAAYIGQLWDFVPSAANIEYHAGVVARHAHRRRLIHQATAAVQYVYDNPLAEAEQLQAEAERMVADANTLAQSSEPGLVWVKELLWPAMERIELLGEPQARAAYIDTGLHAVDEKLGGMEKGDLVLLAARPSMGKSAMGLCNIATHAAISLQKRTAVFSVETKRDKCMDRILGSEARVNMAAMRKRGRALDDEYPRLAHATGLLNTAPLHIDHTPGLTLDQMRVKLRRLIREYGSVELAVVDYLGLMRHPKAKDRLAEVSEISRGLKQIAGEFDIPVVALSQLSRAVEARPDKRPMMSDLRESGTLEQDADIIMLLFRPEYYFGSEMTHGRGKAARTVNVEGKAEIILAKVREGETGTAYCLWEKEYTHFADPQQGSFFNGN